MLLFYGDTFLFFFFFHGEKWFNTRALEQPVSSPAGRSFCIFVHFLIILICWKTEIRDKKYLFGVD